MNYETPAAFRMALEQRLNARAERTGLNVDRYRRRVLLERLVVRLDRAEPGRWVLKGGMALEIRLRDRARRTLDIDLGLRDSAIDPAALRDRIVDAVSVDYDGDLFRFEVGETERMMADTSGQMTWRFRVTGLLDGRIFASVRLDVSPRPDQLTAVERLTLDALTFAGIPEQDVEVIDVHQHVAEKLHALTRTHGDRPNTRVRDLVDVVLLYESGLVDPRRAGTATVEVFGLCATHPLPAGIDDPPSSWADRYQALTDDLEIEARTLPAALALARALWAAMFPTD